MVPVGDAHGLANALRSGMLIFKPLAPLGLIVRGKVALNSGGRGLIWAAEEDGRLRGLLTTAGIAVTCSAAGSLTS